MQHLKSCYQYSVQSLKVYEQTFNHWVSPTKTRFSNWFGSTSRLGHHIYSHSLPTESWERWYPIEKPLKRWILNRVISLGECIMEEACWDDTSLQVLEETSWETPSDRPVPDSKQVGCYLFVISLCANPQGGAPHHIYRYLQWVPGPSKVFPPVRNASQHKTLPHPGALCWPWHHSQTGLACWLYVSASDRKLRSPKPKCAINIW